MDFDSCKCCSVSAEFEGLPVSAPDFVKSPDLMNAAECACSWLFRPLRMPSWGCFVWKQLALQKGGNDGTTKERGAL